VLTPRRLRRAPIIVAALLAPLFSVQSDLALAQPGSLLPSQSDVARSFPYLDGGQRSVFTLTDLTVPQEGCTIGNIVAHAHRGEGATYTLADGRAPYDAGYVEPEPLAYRFANPRVAEKAFEAVLAYVRLCRGRHTDTRATIRLMRQDDPGLGARSLAWRLNVHGSDGHTTFQSLTAHVAALRGRDLVWVSLRSPGAAPDSELAVRLARMTLRTLS